MNNLCPVCDSVASQPIYEARDQPLLMNHLCATRTEAMCAKRCDLVFRGCTQCGFVWNAAFAPDDVIYGPGYVNDQSHSGVFQSHLQAVQRHLAQLVGETPGIIVEVGCGQGGFLQSLCQATGRSGIGFDPALAESRRLSHDVELRAARFDAASLRGGDQGISLIFSRHVLEHLANPKQMLQAMAGVLNRRTASLYIEVPTFEWIASNGAFFDLFNEHCSLFSTESMRRMLRDAGFGHVQVEPVFGGQYLAATASADSQVEPTPSIKGRSPLHEARARLRDSRDTCQCRIHELRATGPVLIWGGAAKGVSVVNQLRLTHRQIPGLIDINPTKQGRFVPVTGQRIIAPAEITSVLSPNADATILVMNPNYEAEIARTLTSLGFRARLEVLGRSAPLEVHR